MAKPKDAGPMLFDAAPVTATTQPGKPIAYHATRDDSADAFAALLARYASGCDVREEVVVAVWPWDDPLQRQIRAALTSAEECGKWKAERF